MFNFKGVISKFQIDRFKALQGFLGGCVHNIGDVAKCVKTIIGVKAQIEGAKHSVEEVISNPDSGMQTFRKIFN